MKNNYLIRLAVFFIILFSVFIFSSCSINKKITAENIKSEASPEFAFSDTQNIPIARIDGDTIFVGDFEKRIEEFKDNVKNSKDVEEIDYDSENDVFFYKKLLDEFMFFKTILTLAKKQKLDESDTFINSVNDFKQQLLLELFEQNIFNSVDLPTEMEINEYYLKNKDIFAEPVKIGLKNILTDSENVISKIESEIKTGKSFDDIANDSSLKLKISDLGLIENGLLDYELEDEAFKLNLNEFSPPIKTRFGYHILFCYQIIKSSEKPLTGELKNDIYHKILQDRYKKKLDDIFEDFKKKYEYSVFYDNLKYLKRKN